MNLKLHGCRSKIGISYESAGADWVSFLMPLHAKTRKMMGRKERDGDVRDMKGL